MSQEDDRWLSVEEIASHLGVTKDSVYRWIDRHALPAHRAGRLWKFRRQEVDAWVLSGGATGAKRSGPLERDPLLAEIVRRLVAAYRPERIYLFGSKARGDEGPDSDYDLLVVVGDDAPADRRRSRLAYQVLRGTRAAADVLVCTSGWFASRLRLPASLPATVMREGTVLHAA